MKAEFANWNYKLTEFLLLKLLAEDANWIWNLKMQTERKTETTLQLLAQNENWIWKLKLEA